MWHFAPKPRRGIIFAAGIFAAAIGLFGALLSPLAAQSIPQALRSAAQSAATSSRTGVVITEDSRLNMRSLPQAGADIVLKLDPGDTLEIIGASDDAAWYEARQVDGDATGWVSAEFVRIVEAQPIAEETAGDAAASDSAATVVLLPTLTPAPSTPASAGATATDTAVLTPTPAAKSLVVTPAQAISTEVTLTTTTQTEITPTQVVTASAPLTAVVASTTPTATLKAAATAQNRPAASSTRVVELKTTPTATAASTLTATATLTATVKVTPTVAASAAKATPVASSPAATPQPTPSVPTAITQPERMNLRGGPGTNYATVGSATAGSAFEALALGPGGEWVQVRVEGAEEPAWLSRDLIDLAGPTEGLVELAQDALPTPPAPAEPVVAQSVAQSAAVQAAPPPSGAGFFGYGMQAHFLGGGAGAALTAVSDLGFDWIKQQVEWRLFQPQAGVAGFGELGGIVSEAGNRGINVLFSVVNSPEWAREAGFDGSVGGPPADPQAYASFVGALAGQFCGTSLKAIEVWNEQNLHYEWGNKPLDPAEYMNLLRPAYAAIKAACPEMLVISGALTPAGSNPPFAMDDFAYLEGMYQNGLANYSDGIGVHPSGYNVPASVGWEDACAVIQQTGNTFNGACDTPHHSWSFRSTMEGYRNIMNVYGDANKRLWPTEFGWAAGGAFDGRYAYANDNGFDEQAAWTVEAYQMMREWGWVGPAFLWNLNFRVVADGSEKAQWGIVGNDYQPLPTYQALKAMPK